MGQLGASRTGAQARQRQVSSPFRVVGRKAQSLEVPGSPSLLPGQPRDHLIHFVFSVFPKDSRTLFQWYDVFVFCFVLNFYPLVLISRPAVEIPILSYCFSLLLICFYSLFCVQLFSDCISCRVSFPELKLEHQY